MKLALLIRYATFILAIAGVIVMTSVMQTIHGQDNATIPPPPVTPPVKPYSGGVAATGIIDARPKQSPLSESLRAVVPPDAERRGNASAIMKISPTPFMAGTAKASFLIHQSVRMPCKKPFPPSSPQVPIF